MTGIEAAATAAASGAVKRSQASSPVEQQLLELAKDTPEAHAAARRFAENVAIRQGIVHRLFQPLAWVFRVRGDYLAEELPRELAGRLADVPEDEIVSPQPVVAVPTLEGLAYSLDEPSLKEMYLNLLARASDRRSASKVHPSFPEVIKQLSPDEARLLQRVLPRIQVPIVNTVLVSGPGVGKLLLAQHLPDTTDDDRTEATSVATWVDNWIRLGLVDVDHARHLADQGEYSWVESGPEHRSFQERHQLDGKVATTQGLMQVTNFGRAFASVVLPTPVRPAPCSPGPGATTR